MWRRLFDVFSGLSSLLFLATAILWVHSYYASDMWNRRAPSGQLHFLNEQTVRTHRGQLWYGWQHNGGFATLMVDAHWPNFEGFHSSSLGMKGLEITGMTGPQVAGFAYLQGIALNKGVFSRAIVMPMWALLLMTMVLPAAWFYLRPQAHENGVCQNCGYDLRATPDRCPECGCVPLHTKKADDVPADSV